MKFIINQCLEKGLDFKTISEITGLTEKERNKLRNDKTQ